MFKRFSLVPNCGGSEIARVGWKNFSKSLKGEEDFLRSNSYKSKT